MEQAAISQVMPFQARVVEGTATKKGEPVKPGPAVRKVNAVSDRAKDSLSPQEVSSAVETLRQAISVAYPDLKVLVDRRTRQMVLRVIDKKTEQLIRQIPTEAAVELAARIDTVLGVIFDEKN